MMKRLTALLLGLLLGPLALAAAYDEQADAPAAVAAALKAANAAHQRVLLIFGANWCPDCRALDASLSAGKNAELLAREFRVVKIDVGRFDRNLELDERYGHPIKGGIPAAVVVSPANEVLYSTKAGELSNARRMDDEGVYGFFTRMLEPLNAKH